MARSRALLATLVTVAGCGATTGIDLGAPGAGAGGGGARSAGGF